MPHQTNFADLAMGNAITAHQAEYGEVGEAGPHIRSSYETQTHAGLLRCDVWREFDMSSGYPRSIWAADFWIDGEPAEAHDIRDAGLLGQVAATETPGSIFAQWAATRIRIIKEHRRVIDWPTSKDLFDDMQAWARRRGTSEVDLPSLKAFSTRMRGLGGVEPDRAARGVHMKYVELVTGRPAAPEVIEGDMAPKREAIPDIDPIKQFADQQAAKEREKARVRKINSIFRE